MRKKLNWKKHVILRISEKMWSLTTSFWTKGERGEAKRFQFRRDENFLSKNSFVTMRFNFNRFTFFKVN